MQILYLSNRPDILGETVEHVRARMPWVTDIIAVVGPAFPAPRTGAGGVVLVADDDVLTPTSRATIAAAGEDAHVVRNVLLRRDAIRTLDLDDVFLMSDDDYRPLRSIPREDFVDDGRLHGYAGHDLTRWLHDGTAFDRAQHSTWAALQCWGAAAWGYGAHMPQAIDRSVWTAAFAEWDLLTGGSALVDEWSLHHGWGRLHRPDRFHDPRPLRTLCWPEWPLEWTSGIEPDRYDFENFYPRHYQPGGLFAGLDTSPPLDDELARSALFTKLHRWQRARASLAESSPDPSLSTPWTATFPRRLAFSLSGRAQRWARWGRLGATEPPHSPSAPGASPTLGVPSLRRDPSGPLRG